MRISLGGDSEKHMKVLGIERFPFSEETLKTNYRKLLMKHHPDRNGNTRQAHEMTLQITKAYEYLKNLASLEETDPAIQTFKEDDDLTKLWKTCTHCDGTGYPKTDCWLCHGDKRSPLRWEDFNRCHICKGKGKVELRPFNPVIEKGAILR